MILEDTRKLLEPNASTRKCAKRHAPETSSFQHFG
jgi:hypothetical protein